MSNRIEKYMVAVLSNPQWMSNVQLRHGNGNSASPEQIAVAIVLLESALTEKLGKAENNEHQT